MEEQQQYENVEQITARAPVARSTVYRWIRDGRLPAYRAGRRLLIPVGAFDAMLHRGVPDD